MGSLSLSLFFGLSKVGQLYIRTVNFLFSKRRSLSSLRECAFKFLRLKDSA